MRYRSLTLAAQKADGGVRRGSGDPPHKFHRVFIDFGGSRGSVGTLFSKEVDDAAISASGF
jgi:hypothetical protein